MSFKDELYPAVAAGVIVGGCMYPFEALKKLLQGTEQPSLLRLVREHGLLTPQYINRVLQETHKYRWYRGGTPFVTYVGVVTTVQLLTEAQLRKAGLFHDGAALPWMAASGAVCGVVGSPFATAMENVVVQQQQPAGGLAPRGPRAAVAEMLRHGGARRFLKSAHLIATRDGVFTSFMFVLNPRLKRAVAEYGPAAQLAASLPLCFIGAAVTHPFDTIATMSQKTHGALSTREALRRVCAKRRGVLSLWDGLSCRFVLFTVFANGIPFVQSRVQQLLHVATVTR